MKKVVVLRRKIIFLIAILLGIGLYRINVIYMSTKGSISKIDSHGSNIYAVTYNNDSGEEIFLELDNEGLLHEHKFETASKIVSNDVEAKFITNSKYPADRQLVIKNDGSVIINDDTNTI
ncbi:MAG: hypothetical protein ACRCWY_11750, partial [Cellulosilyticaceae bacterium]